MKTIFSILGVIAISFVIVSCQREVDDNIPDFNDGPRLVKYIEVDTVDAFNLPGDTSIVHLFSYDAQKRVSRHIMKWYSLGFPDADQTTTDYFYNGNDTLPFKSIAYYKNGPEDFIDTTFFFYANGLVVKDSVFETNISTGQFYGIDVDEYIQSGNTVSRVSRSYFSRNTSAPDQVNTDVISVVRVNGNITEYEDLSTSTGSSEQYRFAYDNHVNPFFRVVLHYPVMFEEPFAKNNVTDWKEWSDPFASTPFHTAVTYTYRADGLPQTAHIGLVPNPGDDADGWRGTYFYE